MRETRKKGKGEEGNQSIRNTWEERKTKAKIFKPNKQNHYYYYYKFNNYDKKKTKI